jgi:hypothetical protein
MPEQEADMAKIDEPVNVRQGEELDPVKIGGFLKDTIPGLEGELTIKQFPAVFPILPIW